MRLRAEPLRACTQEGQAQAAGGARRDSQREAAGKEGEPGGLARLPADTSSISLGTTVSNRRQKGCPPADRESLRKSNPPPRPVRQTSGGGQNRTKTSKHIGEEVGGRSIAHAASGLGKQRCSAQACKHAVQQACGGVKLRGADIAERHEYWRMRRSREKRPETCRTQVVTATPRGCQSITAGSAKGRSNRRQRPERRGRLAPNVVAGVSLRQSEV